MDGPGGDSGVVGEKSIEKVFNVYHKHNPNLTQNAKNLRKSMTKEERHLWYDFLQKYPVRFLRQKVIDNYIVDFYCRQAGLVIELDGSQHYKKEAILRDQIRTEQIEKYGLTVIRIPNNAVMSNFSGVCDLIHLSVMSAISEKNEGTNPTTTSWSPSL